MIKEYILMDVVFALAEALCLMLLWNWLMPTLFVVPTIGYFQSIGIYFLGRLIFGCRGSNDDNDSEMTSSKDE